MNSKEKELFERAKNGDGSVLDDPNVDKVKDEYGRTPLHWLARFNTSEQVQLKTLEHPVDKIKDNLGWTPLHLLAYYSDSEQVQLKILEHPSADKIKNNNGWTPLYLLAYEGTKRTKIKIAQKYGWNKLCKILNKPKKQLMWELLK